MWTASPWASARRKAEIPLKPGKYRIEVRNGEFKPYQEDVELGSHQTIRIKHKFTQPR